MKYLIPILFLLLVSFSSCEDEKAAPSEQKGCLTGVVSGQRVLIRCCTRQEYLAGDNVSAGGTPNLEFYSDITWEEVDNCSDCQ